MNNHKSPKNGPNPEERARMVKDALSALPSIYKDPATQEDELVEKSKKITIEVHQEFTKWARHCVLSGMKLSTNPSQYTEFISAAYLERFRNFSKEELLFLCCLLHTQIVVERW